MTDQMTDKGNYLLESDLQDWMDSKVIEYASRTVKDRITGCNVRLKFNVFLAGGFQITTTSHDKKTKEIYCGGSRIRAVLLFNQFIELGY